MKRRTFIRNSSIVAGGTMLSGSLAAQTGSSNSFQVVNPDWTKPGKELRHSWEGLGNIDQMRWIARKDTLEQLEQAYRELNMRHVRAVGIHHDDLFPIDIDPKHCMTIPEEDRIPRNNWQVIDYIFDSLIDIGINPMYTTAFTPTVMATTEQSVFRTKCNVSPPKSYKEWSEYIAATLKHFKYRYGKQRMDSWYYEVWNEPNLDAFYGGNQAEFFKLWKHTYDAIKSVDNDWPIGGPSTARAEWIDDFLKFSRQNECEPDYIIAHCYNNDSEWAALSPFDGLQEDRTNKSPNFMPGVANGVHKLLEKEGFEGEVHWNEWGRSWFPFDEMRETANEAAFIVKSMAEVHERADYYAYWCLSDIYNQAGYGAETFHGNYGLLNLQGLKKPSYYAFELLGKMGDRQIPHTGENMNRNCNAFVSKSAKAYQAMLYCFDNEYEVDGPSSQISVKLKLPKGISADDITLYQVSKGNNNIIADWKKRGAPDYLKYDEKEEWLKKNTLDRSETKMQIEKADNENWLSFEYETPGIAFLEMEKS